MVYSAEAPRPAVLRREAAELEAKARELKESGRNDEAMRVQREAEELRIVADRRQAEISRDRPVEPERRRQMEQQQERRRQSQMEARPAEPEAPEEWERRIHHAEVAVDNLHAAGLHEMAERLERELGAWRERLERQVRKSQPADQLADHVRELHQQVDELRQQVDELRRALREMRRDTP